MLLIHDQQLPALDRHDAHLCFGAAQPRLELSDFVWVTPVAPGRRILTAILPSTSGIMTEQGGIAPLRD